MHQFRHPAVFTFALVLVTLLAFASLAPSASADGGLPDSDYPELFSWPGTPEAIGLPRFVGTEATPNPLPPLVIPNDFLAEQGRNSLHGDNFNSDTLNYEAPLGIDPVVSSRQLGLLAATEDITTDSSGGGYFHVDRFGRALVGVANQRIQRWEAVQVKKKSWEWQLVDDYDLTAVLNNPDAPLQDAIPDYSGRLWFTTQPGIIGYLDENTGEFETRELGEFLQNGFAIDTDGAIYAVTVEALYRLTVGSDGSIGIDWRRPYLNDGGQGGLLSTGSGTTPTLFGDDNDLLAIAETTPRLSTSNGLVYTYSVKAGQPFLGIIPTNGWYFGALDWETGERVYEVWVGNGSFWNNVLDPVTLGPDGTAFVGTKNGLMAIRDGRKPGPKKKKR